MSDNVIILTGAGSMIPWKAPSTEQITDIIRNDSHFRSYTGQPVGDWLYNKLAGFYHKDSDTVNFETILNAIDYLATFFSSKYKQSVSTYKNLLPVFLEERDELSEIVWFDRIYEKYHSRWKVEAEIYKSYSFWDDYDDFFECLYRFYINLIVSNVESYSKESKANKLNVLFNEFIESFKATNRIYSTTYDRVIPAISNKEYFEGFTLNDGKCVFDNKKVLTQDNINCYYNLHGSIHYDLDFPDNVFYKPNDAVYSFGSGASSNRDQDSRKLINSNIITGFNKSSRILNSPFSQFYYRFCADCINAHKIIIIGYSFGDIHINKAISTALSINDNLKINIIDYFVYDENVEMRTDHDWPVMHGKWDNFIPEGFGGYKIASNRNDFNRIKIYRKGLEQFLNYKEWENMI